MAHCGHDGCDAFSRLLGVLGQSSARCSFQPTMVFRDDCRSRGAAARSGSSEPGSSSVGGGISSRRLLLCKSLPERARRLAVTASTAIAFETIGRANPLAATTFCLVISADDIPISYMLFINAQDTVGAESPADTRRNRSRYLAEA
jgi:hypothetical protein